MHRLTQSIAIQRSVLSDLPPTSKHSSLFFVPSTCGSGPYLTAHYAKMGRKYVYNSAASSSGSDSESSSALPPRRYRRRQNHKHDRPSPQAVAPAPQAASNGSKDENKKKKKPTKPPQESIHQTWDKFSQKKFSKALAVLPFSPVAASTSGDRGNELLLAGYERAAEECRRKVRKIISECRRVNTRYRDPGWDLVSLHVTLCFRMPPALSPPRKAECSTLASLPASLRSLVYAGSEIPVRDYSH